MNDTRTLTQRIGQAENALRAILDRLLSGSGITFIQWVTLSSVARAGGGIEQESLNRQISNALKCDAATVRAAIDALLSEKLLAETTEGTAYLSLTEKGSVQFQSLRQQIDRISERLYGDLPPEELAAAHHVLAIITERANLELDQLR